MSKRPLGHGDLRNMGNFKAFACDYEYYLTLSDKPQSVCLTERQMYILSVWNSYTPWMTRWYNTDDVSAAELATIAAEIEGLLMCGCGIPTPTITDTINGNNYMTETTTIYNTTYNTWNTAGQTVASIAPDLDYSSGTPADIDRLMCLGLEMFLTAIVEQAKTLKQGTLEDNKDLIKQLAAAFGALGVAGGAASAAGVTTGVLGFLAGPWVLLGLALAGVGLVVANIVYPMDLAVFTDAEAFEEIYCTMIVNMVGSTPTRALFQGALSPNAFVPGSHAAELATVIQPYLDNLDAYLQFLVAMNELYGVTDFGIMPDCDCIVPPDPNCVDLTDVDGGWQVSLGRSQWIDGEGWAPVYVAPDWYWRVTRPSETVSRSIQELRITFNIAVVNMRISIAGVNCDFAGPIVEIVLNESNYPALFPFSSGAPNSITVMANHVINQTTQSTLRMIEFCIVPV